MAEQVHRVRIDLHRRSAPTEDAFAAFLALRTRFGPRGVYLLESLGGPERDRRRAVIGVDPQVSLTLTGDVVSVQGRPDPTRALLAALDRSGAVGALHRGRPAESRRPHPGGAWQALRAATALFGHRRPATTRPTSDTSPSPTTLHDGLKGLDAMRTMLDRMHAFAQVSTRPGVEIALPTVLEARRGALA